MDEVSSNTSRRPVISFEEAMQNAMQRKSNVNQAHTPSKYRVEVYLKIPFVAETENRSMFTPKAFDVTAAHRHNNGNQEAYQHPHVPFEGRTTTQDTYVAHPIQKAHQSPSMTVPTYQPVKTPFNGRSHYQVAGVPLMLPTCMMPRSTGIMMMHLAQEAFTPPPMDQSNPPQHMRSTYTPPHIPFEGINGHRADYPQYPVRLTSKPFSRSRAHSRRIQRMPSAPRDSSKCVNALASERW
jgi:hypothetical protein